MARRRWLLPFILAAFGALWLFLPRPEPPKTAQADLVQPVTQPPKLVALTFDDGPKAATTARLLDGLERRGVRATFFLIGAQLEGNEDLVRRMAAAGHQIGVHTYDHVALTDLSDADFDAQVGRTRRELEALLGERDYWLRPPYGMVDDAVERNACSPIILWSVDPEDWHERSVQREVSHIVSAADDGAIILMHDIFPESVDAALQVVDQLHHAGYAFVTVEELFAAHEVDPKSGQIYRRADGQ